VDLRSTPIKRITAEGVRTGSDDFDLDSLVFATGFDAMTGALLAVDIRGRADRNLHDEWKDGPKNYLGLSIPRFPNFFMITGPGSPSVLTNMVASIEQHVEWITDCLCHLRSNSVTTIEAEVDAANAWVSHVNFVASRTLFPTCNSWYLGANIPGKPRIFMPLPGFPEYAQFCATVADEGYQGFRLDP
jgi:cyclohexanone monooxygenase